MIKQYEKYKPIKSSVYKEAPITWNKYRVKDTVDKNTYYPVGDGDHGSIKPEMYQEEGIPYIRVQNLTWHGDILTEGIVCISEEVQLANKKSILYPGDILIAKTGATIGKIGLIPESIKEANTTSSVGKLTVDKKRFSPKYIIYCFQSRALQDQIWLEASQKSAQPGFNIDDLIVFEFLAPDLDGQLKVVEYLDHQTAIIDQLIQQKEKLIVLLNEKRQAVINEAVTKGLNPNAKMKESGIEWLGKVPKHWEVTKLKFIAKLNPTKAEISNNLKDDDSVAFLPMEKVGEDWSYDFKSTARYADVSNGLTYFKEGDIIMAKITPCFENGKAAILERLTNGFGFGSTEFHTIRPLKIDRKYLFYVTRSDYFMSNGESFMTGSAGQKRVPTSFVNDFFVPIPSKEEQIEIAEYIEQQIEKNNFLSNQLLSQIEKLKEYRQSLISEAVTGKIDLRDWQPNNKQMA